MITVSLYYPANRPICGAEPCANHSGPYFRASHWRPVLYFHNGFCGLCVRWQIKGKESQGYNIGLKQGCRVYFWCGAHCGKCYCVRLWKCVCAVYAEHVGVRLCVWCEGKKPDCVFSVPEEVTGLYCNSTLISCTMATAALSLKCTREWFCQSIGPPLGSTSFSNLLFSPVPL